jgi:hypothetical protein
MSKRNAKRRATVKQADNRVAALVEALSRKAAAAPAQRRAPRVAAVAPAPAPRRAAVSRAATIDSGARNQENKLVGKVNHEDAALVNFLDSLTNPNAQPTPVPLLLGEFELETDLYQVTYTSTAIAGVAGMAYVAVGVDNWFTNVNDGTPYNQFIAPNGATQGNVVWSSITNATVVPAEAAVGGANDVKTAAKSLGPNISANTRLRCTAVHLEVWSDSSQQVSQGDITIAAIQNNEAMTSTALNNVSFNNITAYQQDYVAHEEFPLSGWKSGQRVHAHLTQWDEQCFAVERVPASGTVVAPIFALAAVGTGMASGQSFSYRVTMNYETTRAQSFQTNRRDTAVPYLEPARVVNAMRPLRGRRPTLADVSDPSYGNKGVNAMAMANPDKAAALMRPGRANPTFTDNLASTAKKGLSWLAGKIPYVGGLAQSAVDWLFS